MFDVWLTRSTALARVASVFLVQIQSQGSHVRGRVDQSLECIMLHSNQVILHGGAGNFMVLSRPYLTLVAIGLSGIPYTGSPADIRA